MEREQQILFSPFRLDTASERLWQGSQRVSLRPKNLAVLRYLVEHPGRVVSKEELLKAVWPGTSVSSAGLKVRIREIRQALGDDPTAPHFIETVPRQGYRFVGKISSQRSAVSNSKTRNWQLATHLVGREVELEQLHSWLEKALRGERQVVFVIGEPGIGKTAVVKAFLEQITAHRNLWVAHGQCLEQYGAGEAYMPVLQAWEGLCRAPEGERLITLLRQHAPMWLVQMPSLMDPAEREGLQRELMGATRERMLREMVQAVEALTAEKGLVLWLEDLHWSDYSTLDLLSYLAQRQERARLLVIGTYRPVEVLAREHPLREVKQELQVHGQCQEVALGLLSKEAVREYLAARFAGDEISDGLVRMVHQRTEGHPLFMVKVVDHLVAREMIVQHEGQWEVKGRIEAVGVPINLRELIEHQIEHLGPEDQQVLEGASVAGIEFSAAAVAAGIKKEAEEVEERCDRLARREQFLRVEGVEGWPDGTEAGRYSFIHALYQEVLYERVGEARRIRLHRRIGEREEEGYGERAEEIAAKLAIHFERGHDYCRAVQYLEQAGENAVWRYAYREAIGHLTKGLELLKTLPDTPERTRQELTLQIALGVPLMATKGFATPEVERVYARARELYQQEGETSQLFLALGGLWQFYLVRAEYQTARGFGEQILSLAQNMQDPVLLLAAHRALGEVLYFLGELAPGLAHLEQGIALYDPEKRHSLAFLFGADPAVFCLFYAAFALWLLGYPEQALNRSHEALTLAQKLSHPQSLAAALHFAAIAHQLRQEAQVTQEGAEAAITLSTEQEFTFWVALETTLQGRALAKQGQGEEGIAQMRQGLAAYRATGAEVWRPYLLTLLAEAYRKVGQTEEGLSTLAEALATADKTGERFYEAELYRLKGELTLAQSRVQSLESSVQTNQKAKGKGQKAKIKNPQHPIPNTQHPRGGESRSVLSEGHRHCPSAGGEVTGAAGGDEPESAVAETGQERSSPTAAGGNLRLVHRRV